MKISPIFSDSMILQANKPVYVFGSGTGTGEPLYSIFNGDGILCDGMLKRLIDKWRDDFKDAQLPFIVIQIHDYIYGTNGEISGWMDVQAAQEDVCKAVAGTYLVKSADVCETADIHPASKISLALRITEVLKDL